MTRDLSHSLARSAPAGRGGALDALRFAAALLIVLYHYGAEAPLTLTDLHPVFGRGYLATDFFLILSGLVLGRAYGGQILAGRVTLAGFLKKRLTRLWPAQLIVLAVMGLIVLAAELAGDRPVHPGNFTPLAMLMQAFMVQAWGAPGGGGWNHPSWSLSALLVCYAAFPLIWRGVSRLTRPATLLALGLTAMMGADLVCKAVFHHTLYDLDFSLGVVRAAPLFLLGVCIARMVELGAPSVPMARVLAGLAFVAFVMLQIAGRVDLPSLICIAVIVWGFGRLPVNRPSALIEQGAKLSFALFVTHALTGLMWFGALETLTRKVALAPWLHWGLWALSLPLALVVAALFHRFVDEPVQTWLAKRRAPRPAEAPSVA